MTVNQPLCSHALSSAAALNSGLLGQEARETWEGAGFPVVLAAVFCSSLGPGEAQNQFES